jgi:CRISPR-associated protein (TIGR03986 family)
MDFYNPFHFIPVAARSKPQKALDLSREQFTQRKVNAATHERFVPDTHSGRLVVRLTAVTPMVIGAAQSRVAKGRMAAVQPFELDGRPAIPASTLRGMVGAIIEAASNSAARVLENPLYSFRKQMNASETLSALGLVVADAHGKLHVKPMALPTLVRSHRNNGYEAPARFRKIFPVPRFKVYLPFNRTEITKSTFAFRTSSEKTFDYPVHQLTWSGNLVPDDRSLRCKPNEHNPKFAVAQWPEADEPVMRGYIRVLGCWGDRESQIPAGKKHELWIPAPHEKAPALPIAEEALAVFHALADERTADAEKNGGALLPFHPLETARNEDPKKYGKKFRLKPGDMVYFDVDQNGATVTEVALSAIWRGAVKNKSGRQVGTHGFFEAVDPDLVPFGENRNRITIAEQMLGFVENVTEVDRDPERQALALASRIRFADALPGDDVTPGELLEDEPVPLRILSSPKLPSPALYFRNQTGSHIPKAELRPGEHKPQGRKVYLHQRSQPGEKPWETRYPLEHPDQKNQVRPIRRDAQFTFHIDFDNLSDDELALLVYALSPIPEFHHKVGMGRPLGLGSVRLDVIAFQPVNRLTRYSLEGLRTPRHTEIFTDGAPLPLRYTHEAISQLPLSAWMEQQRKRVTGSGLVSTEVDHALKLLGNFASAPDAAKVHYPALEEQRNLEKELFAWFVANERSHRQALPPLQGRQALPALNRNRQT